MDKEILEKFRKSKPFENDVVKSPWDPEVLDAENVHSEVFQKVIEKLDKSKTNGTPGILVLQGEPGSGKSHLLWRIAKSAENKRYLFVNLIPYLSESEITFTAILQNVIESLEKKHSALKSKPIDHFVGALLKQGMKEIKNSEVTQKELIAIETITKDSKLPYVSKTEFEKFLSLPSQRKLIPLIAENLMKEIENPPRYIKPILTGLLTTSLYQKTLELLRGEKVENEELSELHLSGGFEINERIAFEVLKVLLDMSPFPFIISIDQVENIDKRLSKEGIVKFLQNIVYLSENTKNTLFFLTVQTQVFQKWLEFIPEHIKQRFTDITTLKPISEKDAIAIAHCRIKNAWERLNEEPPDYLYPLNEKVIKEIYNSGNKNPRKLLKSLGYYLEHYSVKEIKESVENVFSDYIRKEMYDTNLIRKEASDLVIKLYNGATLRQTSTYSIIQINKTAFAINNSKKSYFNTAKNILSLINIRNIHEGLILRDERFKIPSTTKTFKVIKENPIRLVYYNEEEGKEIQALSKLLRDTESKDTDLDEKEVRDFVTDKMKKMKEFRLLTEKHAVPCKELTIEKIKKIITQKKIITISNLRKLTNIEESKLIEYLNIIKKEGKIEIIEREDGDRWILTSI